MCQQGALPSHKQALVITQHGNTPRMDTPTLECFTMSSTKGSGPTLWPRGGGQSVCVLFYGL